MRIKYISHVFTLVCFLLLFSLSGYCLFESSKNIETYDNPDIDYNSYRYFTFYTDKLSIGYLQNKNFQSSIIELLEEKNYIYVEDMKEADFVIILYSSNLYEQSLIDIPTYDPGKKINVPYHDSTHYGQGIAYTQGSWDTSTIAKGMYYTFIGISCIGSLQNNSELIWQGQGIKSAQKSNLEKYGKELIKKILAKFPELSEKIKEELPLTGIEESENIEMLLEQLNNK